MYNKNAWNESPYQKEAMAFAEKYKTFLDIARTERLVIIEAEKILKANGFRDIKTFKSIKPGDKVYIINRHKSLVAFVIGKKPLADGLHILGSHVDSPRLDLKPNPLYEEQGFALLDTHYYGGIKKYQWLTTPLALIGVVCKKDGTVRHINVGLKKDDPIFCINDLLIHLSHAQLDQPVKALVDGEQLDITIASMPLKGVKTNNVRANVLKILKDKYDIDEEDAISAEIEAVPAYPVRDFGIDRSMVAGYGQDDRACVYTSLMALVSTDIKKLEYSSCVVLTDKEEIGSVGATGAHSYFIENVILDLLSLSGEKQPFVAMRRTLRNSKMISCDVSPAMDPMFKFATAPHRNMGRCSHGVSFNKYTGSRGKRGANDANPEYIAKIRKLLDDHDIDYQFNEMSVVDLGGGGTIAYVLAKYNMEVIDAGIPALNIHSSMEVVSKIDLYEAYLCYKTFLENKLF